MKEFDKIYVAKYDFLTLRQIAEDLNTTQEEITKVLDELKANKLYEVYKNISEYEWDKLEKKQIKIS